MFDANPYLLEKTPACRREALHRLASRRSWLENVALLSWHVLCALLRALGRGMIGLGRLLLRLPEAAQVQEMPLRYAKRD